MLCYWKLRKVGLKESSKLRRKRRRSLRFYNLKSKKKKKRSLKRKLMRGMHVGKLSSKMKKRKSRNRKTNNWKN
jgi:hypothetical protein